jgi:hypothetical protein
MVGGKCFGVNSAQMKEKAPLIVRDAPDVALGKSESQA